MFDELLGLRMRTDVSDRLEIGEVLHDNGAVQHRYGRYRSSDGLRWVRHGLFESYSRDGVLLSQVNYRHGLEHGPCRDFHENGSLAAQGLYRDGKEDGRWLFYSPDGHLQRQVEYALGVEAQQPDPSTPGEPPESTE